MKNGFNCKGKCSKVKLGRIRKNKEIESLQQTLCHPISQTLAKIMNSGRSNNISLKYQIVKIQGLENQNLLQRLKFFKRKSKTISNGIQFEFRMEDSLINIKKLSFCHKLRFSKPNISASGQCKTMIFQTQII